MRHNTQIHREAWLLIKNKDQAREFRCSTASQSSTLQIFSLFITATFGFPAFHSPNSLHSSLSQILVTLLQFFINLGFHINLQDVIGFLLIKCSQYPSILHILSLINVFQIQGRMLVKPSMSSGGEAASPGTQAESPQSQGPQETAPGHT